MTKYHVRIVTPGSRWSVTKATPDGATTTYFVRREPGRLACSCPGYRKGRPCKHARFVAQLIGRPELAASAAEVQAAF